MRRDRKIICPEYNLFIKAQNCVALAKNCIGPVAGHHVVARGWREGKQNDFLELPLCSKHHSEIEQIGVEKFEARYSLQIWREMTYLLIEFWLDEERRAGAIIVTGKI